MQPFNKYYPPDWTPDKGTANQFVGKHPLGDRARKIDQGILVVRFELPFNIWCTGCDNHIGKGVRYNAEKKKIGNYHSTPILQFRMRCHLCSKWIEIHTDPKNSAYVVHSGARKKMEEWEPEDTEGIKLEDEDTKEKLETNPIFRLEHDIQDKKVRDESLPALTQIQQLNETQWKDPYTRSQELRRKLREEKKKDKATHEETERLRDKHSLQIQLLPKSEKDALKAKLVTYADPVLVEADKRKLQKTVSPLFGKAPPAASSAVAELSLRASYHTRLKTDPFLKNTSFGKAGEKLKQETPHLDNVMLRPTKKTKSSSSKPPTNASLSTPRHTSVMTARLVDYTSDSDDE